MPYIGAQPTTAAFITDTFSGTGSQTAFTMSAAPANTNSILVSVSGVLQDPSTYSVNATTLTFSAAPPAGTGNISVRFLGVPASGVVNTAYRTQTEFTATAGQTTFSVPSYTVGYIDVYRNGVLLGSADFTATNGTTVVLASGASAGDLIETISFFVSSVINAIPAQNNAVIDSYILSMAGSKLTGSQSIPKSVLPTGSVLQVVNSTFSTQSSTSLTFYVDTGLSASITPTSASSKILVFANIPDIYNNGSSSNITFLNVVRGSTQITEFVRHGNYIFPAAGIVTFGGSTSYLDSPATTSSTTYKVQIRMNSGTTWWCYNNAQATITLMEIAA